MIWQSSCADVSDASALWDINRGTLFCSHVSPLTQMSVSLSDGAKIGRLTLVLIGNHNWIPDAGVSTALAMGGQLDDMKYLFLL